MSSEDFFILIEGEPHSPEAVFLERQITRIFEENNISYFPRVLEVGGSSGFNSCAKPCYKNSDIHKRIPVLAIADSDYRVIADKKSGNHAEIIANKNVQNVYWQRHEWESYLLSETQSIANFINKFHKPSKGHKFSKNSDNKLTSQELDDWLSGYFKQVIKDEFFECLNFNLKTRNRESSPSLKPDFLNKKSIEEIQQWFLEVGGNTLVALKPIRETLFDEIIDDFKWTEWLSNPESLSCEIAINKFRGKEAIDKLLGYIKNQHQCKFDNEILKTELLEQLPITSAIIMNLERLILAELL